MFINTEHQQNFLNLKNKFDSYELYSNVYLNSCLYLLSSDELLFEIALRAIDFKNIEIDFDQFFESEKLTSTSDALLKLAFNLYTNSLYYLNKNNEKIYTNVDDIFEALPEEFFEVGINAVKLRYNKIVLDVWE